jgi:hypothetical protein
MHSRLLASIVRPPSERHFSPCSAIWTTSGHVIESLRPLPHLVAELFDEVAVCLSKRGKMGGAELMARVADGR